MPKIKRYYNIASSGWEVKTYVGVERNALFFLHLLLLWDNLGEDEGDDDPLR